jgi:hypothetical protein
MELVPVFVTVEAARTPYVDVLPWRITGLAAFDEEINVAAGESSAIVSTETKAYAVFECFLFLVILHSSHQKTLFRRKDRKIER